MQRRYLPFDSSWGMRVDLPVSLAVASAGNVWTCGQCDLEPDGGSRHPDDVTAQTAPVMAHLARVLREAGAAAGGPLHVHAFYVDDGSVDESAWAALVTGLLPPGVTVALHLTPLAALGYPGMVVEIDAVAATAAGPGRSPPPGPAAACRLGDLVYTAGLDAPAGTPAVAAAGVVDALAAALAGAGAGLADVVKLQLGHDAALDAGLLDDVERTIALRLALAGCTPLPVFTRVPLPRLPAPGGLRLQAVALAGAAARAPRRAAGSDTVGWRRPSAPGWPAAIGSGERVFIGMQQPLDARGRALHVGDMAAQTRLVMDRVAALLARFGGVTQHLVKVNTFYAGSADADDLHSNLCVRATYFRKPACPSTGVPLPVLAPADTLLMVDGIAVLDEQP